MSTESPYIDWLYSYLPEFMRTDDAEQQGYFLRDFLTPACEVLDEIEDQLDSFHLLIEIDTAPEEWIDYWLWKVWRWGWYPEGFTLEQKRELARRIPQFNARRGRVEGIEEFMAFFGAPCIVEAREYFWEDVAWGEDIWLTEPLVLVVRILPGASLTAAEIDELLRFQWPVGHVVYIEDLSEEQPSPFAGMPLFGEPLFGG